MSDSFLRRWASRKAQTEQVQVSLAAPAAPVGEDAAAAAPEAGALIENKEESTHSVLPTLEDVRELTCSSDFAPFMREGVAPATRNAALKTLFTDPQFNVMDMMDIYVDDYSKPDPMTPAFLKLLNQAADLGLFATEAKSQPEVVLPAPATNEAVSPKGDV